MELANQVHELGGAAFWTESTLGFRQVFLRDVGSEVVEDDPSQDLPSDGQERDASVGSAGDHWLLWDLVEHSGVHSGGSVEQRTEVFPPPCVDDAFLLKQG